MTLPTDRRKILETVRTVPYGETATTDQLARMTPGLDPENGEDGVREALAANPVPVLIPTHRVRDTGGEPAAVAEQLRAVEGL